MTSPTSPPSFTFADWRKHNGGGDARRPDALEGIPGRLLAAFDIPDGIRVHGPGLPGAVTLRTTARGARRLGARPWTPVRYIVGPNGCRRIGAWVDVDDLFFVTFADYPGP